MNYLKYLALSVVIASLSLATAGAYNAVGSFNGWNNNDPAVVMLDDGTNGDVVSGDNIYTCQTTVPTAGSYEWKIIPVAGVWDNSLPGGSNSWFQTTTDNQLVKMFLDFNVDSTWSPSSAVFYTTAQAVTTGHYVAVGMQTWLGHTQDWDNAYAGALMHDDGLNGDDSSGDNIFTFEGVIASTVTTLTDFHFKVALDGVWTLQIGNDGRSMNCDPGTYWFQALGGDTVRLVADVVKGRIKASNLNRDTHPQPTISAQGGNPGQIKSFTVYGGTIPYLAWSSSDTSVIEIQSYADNTCVVKYGAIGSSTITVFDGWGETDSRVITTSATNAPLFKDWELMESKASSPLNIGGEFDIKMTSIK